MSQTRPARTIYLLAKFLGLVHIRESGRKVSILTVRLCIRYSDWVEFHISEQIAKLPADKN